MDKNDNLDEFLEDFDFKAITEGLGFHHGIEDESKIQTSLKKKSDQLKADFNNRAKKISSESMAQKIPMSMGDLSPFYENKIEETSDSSIFEMSSSDDNREALPELTKVSYTARMAAYVLDLAVIGGLICAYLTGIYLFAKVDILEIVFTKSSAILEMLITSFAFFYLFYFTVLDKTKNSTVGKSLLKLQLKSRDRDRTSLIGSFSRAVISLLSLPLLGLPIILKISDSVSRTFITQRE